MMDRVWLSPVILGFLLPACSDRPEPGGGREAAPAGQLEQLVKSFTDAGEPVQVTVSFGPDAKGEGPPDFVRILEGVRKDARALIERMRGAGARVSEKTAGDGPDSIALARGDRRRELSLFGDLADVELGPKPKLFRFLGEEVLVWQLRALAGPAKAYWLVDGGELPAGYARAAKRLEKLGYQNVPFGGAMPPQDCSVLIAVQPRWLSMPHAKEIEGWVESGGQLLMTASHSSEIFGRLQGPIVDLGFEPHELQAFNAVKDPMSGETTFGSQDARIVVLKGFSTENLATLPFARESEALVELDDARGIRAQDGVTLLTTEKLAWEGELPKKDGKPDLDKLVRLTVGALVNRAGGRVALISGRVFDDKMLNVANANEDFFARLVDWLAFHRTDGQR